LCDSTRGRSCPWAGPPRLPNSRRVLSLPRLHCAHVAGHIGIARDGNGGTHRTGAACGILEPVQFSRIVDHTSLLHAREHANVCSGDRVVTGGAKRHVMGHGLPPGGRPCLSNVGCRGLAWVGLFPEGRVGRIIIRTPRVTGGREGGGVLGTSRPAARAKWRTEELGGGASELGRGGLLCCIAPMRLHVAVMLPGRSRFSYAPVILSPPHTYVRRCTSPQFRTRRGLNTATHRPPSSRTLS